MFCCTMWFSDFHVVTFQSKSMCSLLKRFNRLRNLECCDGVTLESAYIRRSENE